MKQPGRTWFAVQGIIALGLVGAPFFTRGNFHLGVEWLGGVLFVFGVIFLIVSYRVLGKSHSPWTRPIEGAHLVTVGPYAIVRHPVYAAFIVIALGLELALSCPVGLAFVCASFIYYDLRTREEERWLQTAYPEFNTYRKRVAGRLIPGLY
jgi:protein-S-isoprenylcysteine O-methyltransferase Ste14